MVPERPDIVLPDGFREGARGEPLMEALPYLHRLVKYCRMTADLPGVTVFPELHPGV